MVSEKFLKQYDRYLKLTEDGIKAYFDSVDKTLKQRKIFEAMEYAVCGGGKRIRPVTVLAAAEMLKADMGDALQVALAVEFVHNYSLIHDDLPCMDNDDLRRGRKTCHIVYGEDTALLAGDGLLNAAFEILSDTSRFKKLTSKQLIQIIRILSGASGGLGMIGGQIVDLMCEKSQDTDLEALLYLHSRKTGALIRASVACGCVCGGCTDNIGKAMDDYAKSLGLAFQIKDDILDVVGDTEVLGKPIGSDAESFKSTFVSVLGMDSAEEYLKNETRKAKDAIKDFGEKAAFFDGLADFLLNREY